MIAYIPVHQVAPVRNRPKAVHGSFDLKSPGKTYPRVPDASASSYRVVTVPSYCVGACKNVLN